MRDGPSRAARTFLLMFAPIGGSKARDHASVPAFSAGPAPARLLGAARVVLALVLLSSVPLFWPDVPPLVDLPGHIGRYRVQLDLESSPDAAAILRLRMAADRQSRRRFARPGCSRRLIGLEPAVKLIVLTIPPLTAAGLLWVAYEVHGRIPPTALFALPFAYNFPFLFGFVNFALAMALALIAFALWLRLGRLGRPRLRAALFVPISLIIWVVHAFGWGTLGVLAFSAELVRQHDRGGNFFAAGFRAGIHCLSLMRAVPPDAALAQRCRRRHRRLVQLGAQMGMDDHGAARPLGVVRYRLARAGRPGARLRLRAAGG